MHSEYVEYLKEMGVSATYEASKSSANKAGVKQHNWGDKGIALRFFLQEWRGNTNVTLVLNKDGILRIQIYIYDVDDTDITYLKDFIDIEKYKEFWTESKTIRCFGYYNENDNEKILSELKNVTERINNYYKNTVKNSA